MRIRKDGQRFVQDRNAQDFPFQPGAVGVWLSLARVFLGDVELMAKRCGHGEALEVVTVRAALRNLIDFLEKNHDPN